MAAGDRAAGYEGLDPVDVEQARLRAQQPTLYSSLQVHSDNLEDLYSKPIKRR